MLTITIIIKDQDTIDDIKATGAENMLNFFLPKAGLKADKVTLYEVTRENRDKCLAGKEYEYFKSEAKDMVLSETAKDAIKDGLAQCNKTIEQLQEDRKVTPEVMNRPFDI